MQEQHSKLEDTPSIDRGREPNKSHIEVKTRKAKERKERKKEKISPHSTNPILNPKDEPPPPKPPYNSPITPFNQIVEEWRAGVESECR